MSEFPTTTRAEKGRRPWAAIEYATYRELTRLADDDIRQAIICVASEYPALSRAGWGHLTAPPLESVATDAAFQDEVRRSLQFIRAEVTPQEAANSAANSARLTRLARNWCAQNKQEAGVSHGAVIAAAIIAGYLPVRYPGSGLSCAFNMHFGMGIWSLDAEACALIDSVAEEFAFAFSGTL
ncbi:hypothetical protein [Paraburkholderia sp. RL17-337-BIB-A]|uniref:hypothetical protein n=1 Tax=Paraburkholderia sp. RL17-337-BIB-A TaxID=3031636 RepID=UPI0038BA8349